MMGSVKTAPLTLGSAATLELDGCNDGVSLPPRWIGRLEILERLGAGAMGVVYRAHDAVLGRSVAVKIGRCTTAASRSRMLWEAHTLAQLRHPNVIEIYDVDAIHGDVCVIMPLAETTLRGWLGSAARSFDAILDAFVAAGRGLAAAHAAHILHRDFKPDNVLLDGDGRIYVADFGLARFTQPAPLAERAAALGLSTETGAMVGTPAYMAPEQLLGQRIDARADQFSFCVALWEALYGARPFPEPRGDSQRVLDIRLDAIAAGARPPRRADRPAWIARLLLRGLAAGRDQRWPSLEALLDAIAAQQARRRGRRRLALELGAVALGAALVALPPPASPPRPAPSAAIAHTHDGAIAPNGTWFALVVRESLVLQDRAGGALRTLVEHGVQGPIAWSPDSRRLLVGMVPSVTASVETVLVDVDGGPPRKLAVPGYAGFLSDREAVVALPRERSIAIVPLDGDAALPRRCDVPGYYTFLWDPRGLPDGTIVVRAQSVADRSSRLAFLDCRGHAPVFAHEAIDGYALTDTGTVVALVKHDAGDEIVEITSAAKVLSRRPTPSPLEAVLGRRRGVDHVLTRAQRTQLVRVDDGVSQLLQTFDHDMSIYPSPDGNQIAWLRHDRRPQPPGELRISAHDDLAQSRTVLDNALTAGWAPSGRLAALVEDRAPSGAGAERWLVVLDASFHPTRRIAVGDIDPEAAPVWLDEHRIAVRTGDRTRYRWYALDGEAQGEIGDGDHGSTLWLTASPRSGVRAMWRMGPPGAIDEHTEHLWLQTPDGELRPLHVADAVRHYLVPSWSRSGELLVRSLQTGVVSRVDLETGELTLIARLPPTPLNEVFDDHLVVIPYGDVLAVNHLIEVQIATVREDAPSRRSSPRR